jgi:geranylgeranyl diphosphate synthase, type II
MTTNTATNTEVQKYTPIETVRRDVNILLSQVLSERTNEAVAASERYAALWQATESYMLAGGKRIRPYLTVLGYQLYGGSEYDKILHVAAAQEMLNQAMLIHDDIIDKDYVRYGVPNVAGQFLEYYRKERKFSPEQSRHYADSAALLAGDMSIAEAYMLLRAAKFSPEQTLALHDLLHEAIFTVVGGELLDSETFGAHIESTDPLTIVRLKTAVYSVVVPLASGAYLGGADDDDILALRRFGNKLGMAYQLADDVLGVFGDEAVTGKSTMGDLRDGKHTFMMQQTWRRASLSQRKTLGRLFGKSNLTESEANDIRHIIIDSGAKSENDAHISLLVDEASTCLDEIKSDDEGKQLLRDFCYTATRRDK